MFFSLYKKTLKLNIENLETKKKSLIELATVVSLHRKVFRVYVNLIGLILTMLLDEVDNHIPLSGIVDRILEKKVDQTAVRSLFGFPPSNETRTDLI